ncbi:MAG TPA: 3-hydroxyacyl-CoA dehydrogenase NAD-binding domain-containing protein, partial [Chryseolinea sp.]|nr:3-hydroxyacyl-CoA dehydrogenase NAD-binding domain-containing protein [Chryseolinea sp.]
MDVKKIPVGVVGLGLMGCSITTCMLMAGHPVIAVAPVPDDLKFAKNRISDHLRRSRKEGLITSPPQHYHKSLKISEDYGLLKDCQLVI